MFFTFAFMFIVWVPWVLPVPACVVRTEPSSRPFRVGPSGACLCREFSNYLCFPVNQAPLGSPPEPRLPSGLAILPQYRAAKGTCVGVRNPGLTRVSATYRVLCSIWRLLNLVSPASCLWCVSCGTCLLESLWGHETKV